MKKGAKILVIIIVLAVLIVGGILIYRHFKNKDEDGGNGGGNGSGSGNGNNSSSALNDNATFPLKKGSRGKQVAFIQRYINKYYGISMLTVDGIWGNNTERLVKSTLENNYADGQITAAEYNILVAVYNFAIKNNLSIAQVTRNYYYNSTTGTIEPNNGLNNASATNYTPGTSYLGGGII